MRGKLFFVAAALSLVTGCATNASFNAEIKEDGKKYVFDRPVLASGELLDIVVYDSDGTKKSSFAESISDLSSNASTANLASSVSGINAFQAGAIGGAIGVLFDIFSASSKPIVMAYVDDKEVGKVAEIRLNPEYLENIIVLDCARPGYIVNVVKLSGYTRLIPEDTRLKRLNSFQPSCEELLEKVQQGE